MRGSQSMAQAPAPGTGVRRQAEAEAQRVLRVKIRDDEFCIAAGNIPIRVKSKFIEQTGRAVEWYFQPERLGDVALCGLWFLSKLLDGDDVTWDQMLDRWDEAGFTAADIEVIEETAGESDHPEA